MWKKNFVFFLVIVFVLTNISFQALSDNDMNSNILKRIEMVHKMNDVDIQVRELNKLLELAGNTAFVFKKIATSTIILMVNQEGTRATRHKLPVKKTLQGYSVEFVYQNQTYECPLLFQFSPLSVLLNGFVYEIDLGPRQVGLGSVGIAKDGVEVIKKMFPSFQRIELPQGRDRSHCFIVLDNGQRIEIKINLMQLSLTTKEGKNAVIKYIDGVPLENGFIKAEIDQQVCYLETNKVISENGATSSFAIESVSNENYEQRINELKTKSKVRVQKVFPEAVLGSMRVVKELEGAFAVEITMGSFTLHIPEKDTKSLMLKDRYQQYVIDEDVEKRRSVGGKTIVQARDKLSNSLYFLQYENSRIHVFQLDTLVKMNQFVEIQKWLGANDTYFSMTDPKMIQQGKEKGAVSFSIRPLNVPSNKYDITITPDFGISSFMMKLNNQKYLVDLKTLHTHADGTVTVEAKKAKSTDDTTYLLFANQKNVIEVLTKGQEIVLAKDQLERELKKYGITEHFKKIVDVLFAEKYAKVALSFLEGKKQLHVYGDDGVKFDFTLIKNNEVTVQVADLTNAKIILSDDSIQDGFIKGAHGDKPLLCYYSFREKMIKATSISDLEQYKMRAQKKLALFGPLNVKQMSVKNTKSGIVTFVHHPYYEVAIPQYDDEDILLTIKRDGSNSKTYVLDMKSFQHIQSIDVRVVKAKEENSSFVSMVEYKDYMFHVMDLAEYVKRGHLPVLKKWLSSGYLFQDVQVNRGSEEIFFAIRSDDTERKPYKVSVTKEHVLNELDFSIQDASYYLDSTTWQEYADGTSSISAWDRGRTKKFILLANGKYPLFIISEGYPAVLSQGDLERIGVSNKFESLARKLYKKFAYITLTIQDKKKWLTIYLNDGTKKGPCLVKGKDLVSIPTEQGMMDVILKDENFVNGILRGIINGREVSLVYEVKKIQEPEQLQPVNPEVLEAVKATAMKRVEVLGPFNEDQIAVEKNDDGYVTKILNPRYEIHISEDAKKPVNLFIKQGNATQQFFLYMSTHEKSAITEKSLIKAKESTTGKTHIIEYDRTVFNSFTMVQFIKQQQLVYLKKIFKDNTVYEQIPSDDKDVLFSVKSKYSDTVFGQVRISEHYKLNEMVFTINGGSYILDVKDPVLTHADYSYVQVRSTTNSNEKKYFLVARGKYPVLVLKQGALKIISGETFASELERIDINTNFIGLIKSLFSSVESVSLKTENVVDKQLLVKLNDGSTVTFYVHSNQKVYLKQGNDKIFFDLDVTALQEGFVYAEYVNETYACYYHKNDHTFKLILKTKMNEIKDKAFARVPFFKGLVRERNVIISKDPSGFIVQIKKDNDILTIPLEKIIPITLTRKNGERQATYTLDLDHVATFKLPGKEEKAVVRAMKGDTFFFLQHKETGFIVESFNDFVESHHKTYVIKTWLGDKNAEIVSDPQSVGCIKVKLVSASSDFYDVEVTPFNALSHIQISIDSQKYFIDMNSLISHDDGTCSMNAKNVSKEQCVIFANKNFPLLVIREGEEYLLKKQQLRTELLKIGVSPNFLDLLLTLFGGYDKVTLSYEKRNKRLHVYLSQRKKFTFSFMKKDEGTITIPDDGDVSVDLKNLKIEYGLIKGSTIVNDQKKFVYVYYDEAVAEVGVITMGELLLKVKNFRKTIVAKLNALYPQESRPFPLTQAAVKIFCENREYYAKIKRQEYLIVIPEKENEKIYLRKEGRRYILDLDSPKVFPSEQAGIVKASYGSEVFFVKQKGSGDDFSLHKQSELIPETITTKLYALFDKPSVLFNYSKPELTRNDVRFYITPKDPSVREKYLITIFKSSDGVTDLVRLKVEGSNEKEFVVDLTTLKILRDNTAYVFSNELGNNKHVIHRKGNKLVIIKQWELIPSPIRAALIAWIGSRESVNYHDIKPVENGEVAFNIGMGNGYNTIYNVFIPQGSQDIIEMKINGYEYTVPLLSQGSVLVRKNQEKVISKNIFAKGSEEKYVLKYIDYRIVAYKMVDVVRSAWNTKVLQWLGNPKQNFTMYGDILFDYEGFSQAVILRAGEKREGMDEVTFLYPDLYDSTVRISGLVDSEKKTVVVKVYKRSEKKEYVFQITGQPQVKEDEDKFWGLYVTSYPNGSKDRYEFLLRRKNGEIEIIPIPKDRDVVKSKEKTKKPERTLKAEEPKNKEPKNKESRHETPVIVQPSRLFNLDFSNLFGGNINFNFNIQAKLFEKLFDSINVYFGGKTVVKETKGEEKNTVNTSQVDQPKQERSFSMLTSWRVWPWNWKWNWNVHPTKTIIVNTKEKNTAIDNGLNRDNGIQKDDDSKVDLDGDRELKKKRIVPWWKKALRAFFTMPLLLVDLITFDNIRIVPGFFWEHLKDEVWPSMQYIIHSIFNDMFKIIASTIISPIDVITGGVYDVIDLIGVKLDDQPGSHSLAAIIGHYTFGLLYSAFGWGGYDTFWSKEKVTGQDSVFSKNQPPSLFSNKNKKVDSQKVDQPSLKTKEEKKKKENKEWDGGAEAASTYK